MTQGALAGIRVPKGWTWEPLSYLAPRVNDSGRGDLQPLSVFLGAGVVRRADRDDNHNALGSDLNKYLHVQPGDLVFNKLRTWQGGLGASKYEGIVSPAYYVLRTGVRLDARFAHYALISSPYLGELTRLSKFMPPSQFDIPWELLKRLPMLVPPLEEQRRIADFLDDQVGRIDQAIQFREKQGKQLLERFEYVRHCAVVGGDKADRIPVRARNLAWLEHVPAGWNPVPLSVHFTFSKGKRAQFLNSEYIGAHQGEFPVYSGQTGGDGVFGMIEDFEFQVERGCVLVSTVGASAMSTRWLTGRFSLSQNCAVIVPKPGAPVDSKFLSYLLPSLFKIKRAEIPDHMQPSLRISDLNQYWIALPPIAEQEMISTQLDQQSDDLVDQDFVLRESISLLQERKRSLITAAVTGHMDVTAAKPMGMGKWVPNVGSTIDTHMNTAATAAPSIGGI